MSRSLLAALVAAFLAIVPAAARAQDGPTLTFDKPCYAEGDPMAYSGAGFTPGGEVNFLFSTLSSSRVGSFDTHADTGGAIAGTIDAPDRDMFLDDDERSGHDGRGRDGQDPRRPGRTAGPAVRGGAVPAHTLERRGRPHAGAQADARGRVRLHRRDREDARTCSTASTARC